MIIPPVKVFRKQLVEGYVIPAFIRNGGYFFVDIEVYADGRVSCWNFEDYTHFKKDVDRGWVSINMPNGEYLSIHGLGNWQIKQGNWLFDKNSFVDYTSRLLEELNPRLENIYTYREKEINGIRVGESCSGTIYKEIPRYKNDVFPDKINGDSVNLFYKLDAVYYLVKASVFADGTIQLTRLAQPVYLTFDELNALVKQQQILTDIPVNSSVCIYGLGEFVAVESSYATTINDKVLELHDMLSVLNGKPSVLNIGREDYDNYLKFPTIENKEKLKISYENIPEHLQMFIGDMDTKDVEVRMIIYGEQEIENWSHYQMAKAQGLELPTIQLPEASDDSE